jgi:hypothetical protein
MNVRYIVIVIALLFLATISLAQKNNSSSISPYNFTSQKVYISVATPPTVITDTAINITQTITFLKGTVNPEGSATQAQFQYGQTTSYGSFTPLRFAGSGNSNVIFSDTAFGLTPNTLYHFRLTATKDSGTVFGNDMTFTTLPNPPVVLIEDVDDITLSSANAHAQVNPNGASTTAYFEWGINGDPVGQTDSQSVGSGIGFVSVEGSLQPLLSSTTYYVVAVAVNSGGTSVSDTAYFTTLSSEKEYLPDSYTVALFHMNEPVGDLVQDYSANTNWGTAINSPPIIEGKYGNARSFDNTTDVVEINHIPDYNFDGDFTLEAWVNPELFKINDLVVIAKGNTSDSSEAYRFSVLSDGSIEVIINTNGKIDGRYITKTENFLVNDDQWQHIAATFQMTTSEVKIFYNGRRQEVTTVGIPGPPVSSLAPLSIGLATGGSFSNKSNLFFCGIDEVRLSNKARTPVEFNLSGSISGIKFRDINGNGVYDYPEVGLQDWKILLHKRSSASSSVDTAVTDSTGYYSFTDIAPGSYILGEVQQEDWVQTAPPGEVYHIIISGGEEYTDLNFGNLEACRYLGGNPLNTANWSCGHLPSINDPIIVRSDTLDLDDIIISFFGCFHSFQAENGGHVSYSSTLPLCIKHKLRIDENSTFEIPSGLTSQSAGAFSLIHIEGSLINNGTLIPGNTPFFFQGNKPKVIASNVDFNNLTNTLTKRTTTSTSNNFYDLIIDGDSTFANGNITVENQLILNDDLDPQPEDTIIIRNSNAFAFGGTGKIPDGSVRRMIQDGSSDPYRFSDVATYLQFDGTGDYPDSVTVTVSPNTTPRAFTELKWEVFDTTSVVDTVNNTITVTGINKFSKWTAGTSGSGNLKRSEETPRAGDPAVSRQYAIKAEGGDDFTATLSISYEQSEFSGTGEDSLRILRGPYFVDTLYKGWNILSLPVIAEDNNIFSLFPPDFIASQAFEFIPGSGYQVASQLEFGKGYWLKFSGGIHAAILGDDRETTSVVVEDGWNLIGIVSYPLLTSSVTAQGTNIISNFFGYRSGYFPADTLQPLHGYWVKVAGNGALHLISSGQLEASLKNSLLKDMNMLKISDAQGNEQSLFFGASKYLDPRYFELPPLPPNGVFDTRFGTGTMLELTDEKVSKEVPLQFSSVKVPIDISWNINGIKNATLKIGNKEIPLNTNGSVEISDLSKPIALRLLPSQNSDVPKEFVLYQNYPNPFNPSTQIRFDLAADAIVTLKVYNILGQEVTTVVDNRYYKIGRYSEQFNNSNLASGVYFYRITAVGQNGKNSYSSMKKMILLR